MPNTPCNEQEGLWGFNPLEPPSLPLQPLSPFEPHPFTFTYGRCLRGGFGSSHFSQTGCVSRPGSFCFVLSVSVSRGCMPRKGSSSLPVPDGWFEVIRRARPPSVQWPHQQKGKGKGVAPSAAPRGRWTSTDPAQPPELCEEGQSSGTRRSTWSPVGTVFEIRRTIGEVVASPRRRAREGSQAVGGSETTCRTFTFRVGSRESTTPPPTVPADNAQELVQLRVCSRGRSRLLPNPSPDLFTGELQHGW